MKRGTMHSRRRTKTALLAATSVVASALSVGWVTGTRVQAASPIAPQTLAGTPGSTQSDISGDGRVVVYVAPPAVATAGAAESVWVFDMASGTRRELTVPVAGARSGNSRAPRISADGCTVVVTTEVGFDLLYDNDNLNRWDVYRTVLPECEGGFELGEWELVSASVADSAVSINAVDPSQPAAVSAAGTVIAYARFVIGADGQPLNYTAIDLVDATVPAGQAGRVLPAPGMPTDGPTRGLTYLGQRQPAVSLDGRYVAYTSDAVFTVVENPDAVTLDEQLQSSWNESDDGTGTAVSHVYRVDRDPGDLDESFPLQMVSVNPAGVAAAGSSSAPDISQDGRFISFTSSATDLQRAPSADQAAPLLAAGAPSQIYRADLDGASPVVELVSHANGVAGDAPSVASSIDAAGQQIAFLTRAGNLVSPNPATADPLGSDVLLANPQTGALRRLSTRADGSPASAVVTGVDLSATGRFVTLDALDSGEFMPLTANVNDVANVVVLLEEPKVIAHDINMATTQVGRPSLAWYVNVQNTGKSSFVPATIESSNAAIKIIGGTCRVLVPVLPGENCQVNVQFTPTRGGQYTSNVTLTEQGFSAVTATAVVTANGGVPTVTSSPNSSALGSAVFGIRGGSADIRVGNLGSASATVESVTMTGTHPGDFVVDFNTCTGKTLAVSQTCTVKVTFVPLGAGPRSGVVTIKTKNGGTATTVVSGIGRFEPVLSVTARKVRQGEAITVKGSGLPGAATLTLTLERGGHPVEVTTDFFGGFTAEYVVSGRAPVGRNRIVIGDPIDRFEPTSSGRFIVSSDDDDDESINPDIFG